MIEAPRMYAPYPPRLKRYEPSGRVLERYERKRDKLSLTRRLDLLARAVAAFCIERDWREARETLAALLGVRPQRVPLMSPTRAGILVVAFATGVPDGEICKALGYAPRVLAVLKAYWKHGRPQ